MGKIKKLMKSIACSLSSMDTIHDEVVETQVTANKILSRVSARDDAVRNMVLDFAQTMDNRHRDTLAFLNAIQERNLRLEKLVELMLENQRKASEDITVPETGPEREPICEPGGCSYLISPA